MKVRIRMRSSGYTAEIECDDYKYSSDTITTLKGKLEKAGDTQLVNGLFFGVETVEVISDLPKSEASNQVRASGSADIIPREQHPSGMQY